MPLILPGNVASATASTTYDVDNSCRFNQAAGAYLTRTLGTPTNADKFTLSMWIKRGTLTINSGEYPLCCAGADSSNGDLILFRSGGYLEWQMWHGGATALYKTNRSFNDTAAWYHLVFTYDSGNATAGDRMKIYVNGTEETSFSTETDVAQNTNSYINSANAHGIGDDGGTDLVGGTKHFDGYMAEVVLCDGQAYAASDFGEYDSDSPTIWKPKDVSGLTFGNNGFYLPFTGDGTLTAFTDEGHNSLSVTTTGNATHSFAQSKIGGSSIYFDGSGDKIITGTHSDFNTGTGDWTIELWVYKSATMTNHQIANTSDGSAEGHGWQIEYTSNILGLYIWDLADDWTHYAAEDDEASTDNWHHYAWVRDSDVHKLYRNGILQSSTTTDTTGITPTTNGWVFGEHTVHASRDFNGYLDQIRISDNARYSSNFSAPTTEFSSDSNTLLLIQSKGSNLIGGDVSGQGNHFTETNIDATDQATDTPTNNFCTWNPLRTSDASGPGDSVFSEGNTELDDGSGDSAVWGTMGVSTGKWYWEFRINHSANVNTYVGVRSFDESTQIALDPESDGYIDGFTFKFGNDGTGSGGSGSDAYVNGYQNGARATIDSGTHIQDDQILGVNMDLDNGKVYLQIDGADIYSGNSVCDLRTGTGVFFTPYVKHTSSSIDYIQLNTGGASPYTLSSAVNDDSGYGNFEYAPKSGYLALCTKNLAEYGG